MTMTPLLNRRIARPTLRTALCLIVALAIALAPAYAQDDLIAYFPLDGDPAPGTTHGAGTETVPGMIGDALMFNGDAVIALPLDLGQHHQLTFTAWVKVTDPGLLDGKLVSSGNQPGPELYLRNGEVVLHAGRKALKSGAPIPIGEWTFVAGVVDFDAAEARVHQGDLIGTSSGEIETDLSRLQPRSYEDPDDPQADKQRFVFIGARDFRLHLSPANPADGIAIDDVRIYSTMLRADEIEAMRTNPQPLAIGPYPPPADDAGEDGVADAGDGTDDSGGGDTDGNGDTDSDGDDQAEDDGDLTLIGVRLDDQFYVTSLSGDHAERIKTLDLETAPVQGITIDQKKSGLEYRPCYISIGGSPLEGSPSTSSESQRDSFENGCSQPRTTSVYLDFEDGYYLQSLQVCQNKRKNNRIKGLKASAVRVVVNEYTDEVVFQDAATLSDSVANCREWRQTIRCGDDAVATGVRVRYDKAQNSTLSFTGLELVCRKVIPRYEY